MRATKQGAYVGVSGFLTICPARLQDVQCFYIPSSGNGRPHTWYVNKRADTYTHTRVNTPSKFFEFSPRAGSEIAVEKYTGRELRVREGAARAQQEFQEQRTSAAAATEAQATARNPPGPHYM
eukprot:scaffold101992_cov16-Tisochrysis_lutea.AAC.1